MSDFKEAMEQFEELATQLYLNENKRYTAGLLLPRFKEAADRNRQDVTINQAAFVIEQVAQKDPAREVTANDLRELGQQFYQNGTDFNNEFADLLEEQTESTQVETNRLDYSEGGLKNIEWDGAYEREQTNLYSDESDIEMIIDPTIACTDQELRLVRQAAQLIDDEIKGTRRVAKISSILRRKTDNELLFQTTLRTASSESEVDVFIPVEVSNEIPLFPQVMATTEKVYTLDSEGLDNLTADINSQIHIKRAQHISNLRSAEDYEIAIRNDNMGKYAEEVDEFSELSESPKASLGHEEIEKTLRDAVLEKETRYTQEARNAGRELVETELQDLGFQHPQVSFNGDFEHGLTYEANVNTGLGKMKIVVAVEENKNLLFPPSQFKVANEEQIYTLTKEAINQAARSTKDGLKAEVHPFLYAKSYPELKKQLKAAAHHKQHKLAQDIISLIDEKFGDYYRNAATDDYQTWLEESTQSYDDRCGGCDYYAPQTTHANNDYCNLVKTAAKNVNKDEDTEICTRSTYANLEDTSTFLDNGESITINWDD